MTLRTRVARGRTKLPLHEDQTTWLHRGEAAKILGIARDGVRYLESNGALHPIKDARGDTLFDPDEVRAHAIVHPPKNPKRYADDGDLAAAAFDMFDRGCQRREVIKQLRIIPPKADELFAEWKKSDFESALAERRTTDECQKLEKEEAEQDRKRQERRKATLAILKGSK